MTSSLRPEALPVISVNSDVVFPELDIALLRHRQTKRNLPIYQKAKFHEIEEELKKVG